MMYVSDRSQWLFLLIILLSGCRKEDLDEAGPSISIITPGNSTSVQVPDTIPVQIQVSDDHVVQTVWITLADINGVPIAPSITVEVNSTSATIQENVIVSNTAITSGTYSLSVRATDGTNTSSAFRSVNIQEAPLRLRAIYVASLEDGIITRIDSAGNSSVFTTVADLSEVEINSFTQQLFVSAGPFDPLQVIAVSDDAPSWQVPHQNAQPGNYFTAVFTDPADRRTYVSSNDGAIRSFDRNGITQLNAQAIVGFKPYHGCKAGDKFVSEQHGISTSETRLACYTYNSGDLLQSFAVDTDPLEIFHSSDQQIHLFGERDGEGVIQQWNLAQGANTDLQVFAEGAIRAVDAISTTTYVVVLPTQVIRYDQPVNSVFTLLNATALDVAFDRANGTVLAAVDEQLFVIDPITGNIFNTIDVPHQIDRILPLFDR